MSNRVDGHIDLAVADVNVDVSPARRDPGGSRDNGGLGLAPRREPRGNLGGVGAADVHRERRHCDKSEHQRDNDRRKHDRKLRRHHSGVDPDLDPHLDGVRPDRRAHGPIGPHPDTHRLEDSEVQRVADDVGNELDDFGAGQDLVENAAKSTRGHGSDGVFRNRHAFVAPHLQGLDEPTHVASPFSPASGRRGAGLHRLCQRAG